MKTVQLICFSCGEKFTRLKKQNDRNIREGISKTYCSYSCSNRPSSPRKRRQGNKYTPFIKFMENAQRNNRKKGILNITKEYLYGSIKKEYVLLLVGNYFYQKIVILVGGHSIKLNLINIKLVSIESIVN